MGCHVIFSWRMLRDLIYGAEAGFSILGGRCKTGSSLLRPVVERFPLQVFWQGEQPPPCRWTLSGTSLTCTGSHLSFLLDILSRVRLHLRVELLWEVLVFKRSTFWPRSYWLMISSILVAWLALRSLERIFGRALATWLEGRPRSSWACCVRRWKFPG